MWYVCEHCGRVYEENELSTYTEYNDYGTKETLVDEHCRHCGRQLKEGFECCCCGEIHSQNQLYDCRFCKNCLDKISRTDVEQMLEIGNLDDYKETIQINGLLANVFNVNAIEHILSTLLRCMQNHEEVKKSMNEFISCDYEAFAENLPCGYGIDKFKK